MIQNIIFFPFTHITEIQFNTLFSFFPAISYFPANADFKLNPGLQKLYEQQKIHPFFSSSRVIEEVERKIEEYIAWAQIHKGNEHNLKALFKDNPYFTSETNVTAIKSQIKGHRDLKENALTRESIEHDLLFLKMAHQSDRQNEQIDLELQSLDRNCETLFSTLRGTAASNRDGNARKTGPAADSGATMTQERIRSWAACMSRHMDSKTGEGNPLFVTTSEAVFEYLESNCKDVVNALDIDTIKVHENGCENKSAWQHHFTEYLMRVILQGEGHRENRLPEVNDQCSLSGKIQLNLLSGDGINDLFNLSDKQIPVCLISLK